MDNIIPVIEKISIAGACLQLGAMIGVGLAAVFSVVLGIMAIIKLGGWLLGAAGGKAALGRAAMGVGTHAAKSHIDNKMWDSRRAQSLEDSILAHESKSRINEDILIERENRQLLNKLPDEIGDWRRER